MAVNVLSRIGGTLKLLTGYPAEPVSRREFISFAARNTVLGVSAGYLAWEQVTGPRESTPLKGVFSESDLLKQKILGILSEVQRTRSMSPRYQKFISKISELAAVGDIKFTTGRNLGPSHRDFNAYYDLDNRTITVDMADRSRFNDVEFNSLLIHELFHAYQDWSGMPMKRSRMEAEAYLAEVDYLYHNNHSVPNAWLALLTTGNISTVPTRFNVPISVLKKVLDVPFDSPQYRQAVKTVGDNFIWVNLFRKISRPDAVSTLVAQTMAGANPSLAKLHEMWSKVRKGFTNQPASFFHLNVEQRTAINVFLLLNQLYSKALVDAGRHAEIQPVLSKTFTTFKRVLRSTDISKVDNLVTFSRWTK